LLGVVVLREKLRALQWVAVALGGVAIIVLAIGYGEIPWFSLVLAVSFALYGLVKKQAGNRVGAIAGLLVETMWLAVPAAGLLVFVGMTGGIELGKNGVVHTVLLVMSGVITAVPLLLFASGARRLPLVTLGLILYVAPVLSFIIGAFVLREHMPPERWAGFAIVWVAIAILTVDMFREGRLSRRALPELT
jgi:chloramphenicol-sensitive protein RarD